MDSLSKKLQNLGIHDIRNAARFAQNMVVQYEPYQIDVRRATNTDAWGPTPKHLSKVLRHRYQVPLYLLTEYILKRLIDHIASKPKNLYEKARKDYVNYGSEWRVVLKCLVVIEYLLLNVDDGDELNQIKSCLVTHKHILTKEVSNFKIRFSNDGKMEIHERGIQRKNENILQLLDDSLFLKNERIKNKKNQMKIQQQAGSAMFNANEMDTMAYSSPTGNYSNVNNNSYNNSSSGNSSTSFNDDDDDDDFNDFGSNSNARRNTSITNERKRTNLEEQRRQRREILRERIKVNEQQRKNNEQQQQQQQHKQEEVPDLLDLDFGESSSNTAKNNTATAAIPTTSSTNINIQTSNFNNNSTVTNSNSNNNANDDDEFGDFLSDTTVSAQNKTNINNTATTNNNNTNSAKLENNDLFADLFNNSKSLI